METSYTLRERKDTGKRQAIIRQKQGNTRKQVQSKTFVKNTDAKQWAITKSSEWQKKIESNYDKMTIRQLKDIYLESKKLEVRESTFLTIRSNIDNANRFDDKTVYQISRLEILNKNKTESQSHIKYMRMFYNFLINDLDFKISNPFKTGKIKKESETFVLSKKDFEFLLKRIKYEDVKMGIIILYHTGLRISELSGLTWDCINDNNIIINKQLYSKFDTFSETKSENSVRTIPIHSKLRIHLKTWKTGQTVIHINNRIFNNKAIGQKITNELRRATEKTYLEGLTPHDFRHTFITNLVQNKTDIITVAYLAGDRVETILKNYVHINDKTMDLSKQAIEMI